MAIRRIIVQGDERLTKKCRKVLDFNSRLHILLDDMKDTLSEAQGAGLAASQVGILRRAVIITVPTEEGAEDQMVELVNPEIIRQSGEQSAPEGCLSVPGRWGMVTRPTYVLVRAQDRWGEWFEMEGIEMVARCLCHEIEHLDGHLYVEHIDHFMTEKELDDYYAQEEGRQ